MDNQNLDADVMEQCEVPLSMAEAVEKINVGGWYITSGSDIFAVRLLKKRGMIEPHMLAVRATVEGENVCVEIEGHRFIVPGDNIVLFHPYALQFRQMAECGVRNALRLTNPTIRQQCEQHEQELAELARKEGRERWLRLSLMFEIARRKQRPEQYTDPKINSILNLAETLFAEEVIE